MDLPEWLRDRGRVAVLAKGLRLPPSFVSRWKAGSPVPAERCPAIEAATGGAVTCEELRPDVAWHVLRHCTVCATSRPVNLPGAGLEVVVRGSPAAANDDGAPAPKPEPQVA